MKRYFEAFSRKLIWRALSHLKIGHLTIEFEGKIKHFGQLDHSDLSVHVHIHSPAFFRRILLNGSVGAGESFMLGEWTVSDLTLFIRLMIKNSAALKATEGALAKFGMAWQAFYYRLKPNTVTGAKKNIIKHYDLGNDFFATFLDKKMMYSAAVYPTATATLEDAASYKLQVICEKLKLKPGDKVLEIGTGWGGLALYAAQHYGCEITTTTISEAQYTWAHQAIQSANLGHKIHLLKEDYRMLTGRYDKIVSIEMIEAVGHRYLGTYLKKLASLLTENGQILIQAICISDQHYERAKYEADFIKQYIFPGGFLPSLTAIASTLTEKTNLRIIGVEDIGLHYAKTLFDWRQRFIEATDQIMAMGYSLIFFRMWIYYLCYCEAAFLEQYISDFQIVMIKSGNQL